MYPLSMSTLQADYASLLQQYQELKDTSIAGLEGMLVEHTSKVRAMTGSCSCSLHTL